MEAYWDYSKIYNYETLKAYRSYKQPLPDSSKIYKCNVFGIYPIIVKVIILDPDSFSEQIKELEELLKLQQEINHPNILKIYFHFFKETTKKKYYIGMEYAQQNLEEYLSIQKFDELEASQFAQQIQAILELLSRKNKIHSNLKPTNIFYGNDGNFKVSEIRLFSRNINQNFMAPEINVGKACTEKSDIFSFGLLILYTLLENKKDIEGVNRNESKLKELLNQTCSRYMKQFLKHLLDFKQENRYTWKDMNQIFQENPIDQFYGNLDQSSVDKINELDEACKRQNFELAQYQKMYEEYSKNIEQLQLQLQEENIDFVKTSEQFFTEQSVNLQIENQKKYLKKKDDKNNKRKVNAQIFQQKEQKENSQISNKEKKLENTQPQLIEQNIQQTEKTVCLRCKKENSQISNKEKKLENSQPQVIEQNIQLTEQTMELRCNLNKSSNLGKESLNKLEIKEENKMAYSKSSVNCDQQQIEKPIEKANLNKKEAENQNLQQKIKDNNKNKNIQHSSQIQQVSEKSSNQKQSSELSKSSNFQSSNIINNQKTNYYKFFDDLLEKKKVSSSLYIFKGNFVDGDEEEFEILLNQQTQKFYKRINKQNVELNEYESAKLVQEIKLLKFLNSLKNPNLPSIIEMSSKNNGDDTKSIPEQIIMERPLVTLKDIMKEGILYSEAQIFGILYDLCKLLNLCFTNRIALRNISPNNIMINELNCKYVISNFSEAIQLKESETITKSIFIGDTKYMSLEIYEAILERIDKLKDTKYKEEDLAFDFDPYKADISSLGLILLELMLLHFPNFKDLIDAIMHEVRNGSTIPQELLVTFPKLAPLVKRMLTPKFNIRPTYQQILNELSTEVFSPILTKEHTIKICQARLKVFSKIDTFKNFNFEQIAELIEFYDSNNYSYQNIEICEYCLQNLQQLNDNSLALIYLKYGNALSRVNQFEEASQQLKNALKILEKDNLSKQLEIAEIYNSMAFNYYLKKEYDKALETILVEVVKRLEICKDNQSLTYGRMLLIQGFILYAQKEFQKVRESLQNSIHILQNYQLNQVNVLQQAYLFLVWSYLKQLDQTVKTNQSQMIFQNQTQECLNNSEKFHSELSCNKILLLLSQAELNKNIQNRFLNRINEVHQQLEYLIGKANIDQFLKQNSELQQLEDISEKGCSKFVNYNYLLKQQTISQRQILNENNLVLDIYLKAEPIILQRYQKQSSEYVEFIEEIAKIYMSLQNFQEAFTFYKESKNIKKELLNNYQNIMESSDILKGQIYQEQGRYSKALKHYRRILTINTSTILLHQKQQIDKNLCRLIELYYPFQQSHEEMIEVLSKIIQTDQNFYGKNHPIIAQLLTQKALILNACHKYNEALAFSKEALAIRQNLYGNAHQLVADSLNNLGLIYGNLNQITQGLFYCQQAQQICLQIDGFFSNGYLCELNGEFNEAIEIYQLGVNSIIELHGNSHQKLLEFYKRIENIYIKKLNQSDKAQEFTQKIEEIEIFQEVKKIEDSAQKLQQSFNLIHIKPS